MSNVWNVFQEKLKNNQILTKKTCQILWYPVKAINISDMFYQIQNFLRASWASIITTNGINFLMAGPFPKQIISRQKLFKLTFTLKVNNQSFFKLYGVASSVTDPLHVNSTP